MGVSPLRSRTGRFWAALSGAGRRSARLRLPLFLEQLGDRCLLSAFAHGMQLPPVADRLSAVHLHVIGGPKLAPAADVRGAFGPGNRSADEPARDSGKARRIELLLPDAAGGELDNGNPPAKHAGQEAYDVALDVQITEQPADLGNANSALHALVDLLSSHSGTETSIKEPAPGHANARGKEAAADGPEVAAEIRLIALAPGELVTGRYGPSEVGDQGENEMLAERAIQAFDSQSAVALALRDSAADAADRGPGGGERAAEASQDEAGRPTADSSETAVMERPDAVGVSRSMAAVFRKQPSEGEAEAAEMAPEKLPQLLVVYDPEPSTPRAELLPLGDGEHALAAALVTDAQAGPNNAAPAPAFEQDSLPPGSPVGLFGTPSAVTVTGEDEAVPGVPGTDRPAGSETTATDGVFGRAFHFLAVTLSSRVKRLGWTAVLLLAATSGAGAYALRQRPERPDAPPRRPRARRD